jgi:hypothetical protein
MGISPTTSFKKFPLKLEDEEVRPNAYINP